MDDYTMPRPVLDINYERQEVEGVRFFDMLGESPLQKQSIYELIDADANNINEVDITHSFSMRDDENAIEEFNDNPEDTPEDYISEIDGIIMHDQEREMWIGAMYCHPLQAWVGTFEASPENKDEMSGLHNVYISGYITHKSHAEIDIDEAILEENQAINNNIEEEET